MTPTVEDEGYAFRLELRCPGCGASVETPVYHRMARCAYCGSEHVVAGHGGSITTVVPDAVTSLAALRAAVVKHFRHLRYLKLYDQHVRALQPPAGTLETEEGVELIAPRASRLANAAEELAERAADAYAEKLSGRLIIHAWQRFLAPWWHRSGTLYQVAFGRDAGGAKRMEFAVSTLEASLPGSLVALPEMGKLSYLRALRPLLGAPESELPALPVERPVAALDERLHQLSQRRVELTTQPIARRASFVPEIQALVYRPWHVAEVELDGSRSLFLVDGAAAGVAGEPPSLPASLRPITGLPEEAPALVPSHCPDCGARFAFEADAVVHLCTSCYRVAELQGRRWQLVRYVREEPAPESWMVPFWRFPFAVRTASGELITDFPHLTDGVDGTLDQIGDAPARAEHFFVPAFRTRAGKPGMQLYRRLWPLVEGRQHELTRERFSPARPPGRVVEVTLPAGEARVFASAYLALAFTHRDLARARIATVRERFLAATVEGTPELAYLNLAAEVVAPFAELFGRPHTAALAHLEGVGE